MVVDVAHFLRHTGANPLRSPVKRRSTQARTDREVEPAGRNEPALSPFLPTVIEAALGHPYDLIMNHRVLSPPDLDVRSPESSILARLLLPS